MSDIKVDPGDYNGVLGTCQIAEVCLLKSELEVPAPSSNSATMLAFMQQVTKVGALISQYKGILKSDVETLEDAKMGFFEADRASAENFK